MDSAPPNKESRRSGITAIILTRNEEIHLPRCLDALKPIARRIIVVDSGSTDRTEEIARAAGAEWFVNTWVDYATQLRWALKNIPIDTEWTLRMDADEYITSEHAASIRSALDRLDTEVAGATLRLRRIFMGKWLRHGGLYPLRLLRIWRTGQGQIEDKRMDEHVLVSGRVADLDFDFADHNLNNLSWWSQKHIGYAAREAEDHRARQSSATKIKATPFRSDRSTAIRNWIKHHCYSALPGGLRAFMFFGYRYIIRLGLLDGRKGFYFHALQCLWYRTLVDALIYEELQLRNQQED